MAHHIAVIAKIVFVYIIDLLIHRIVWLAVSDFARFLPVHGTVLVDKGVGTTYLATKAYVSLGLLVLILHHTHTGGASTTAVNAWDLVAHTAPGSFCASSVVHARSTADLVLLCLVWITTLRNIKHIIPHIRPGAEALSPMLRRFYDHDVLQTELLIDNESLLGVIINAVNCNIEAINIKQEVGLDDPVNYD